MDDKITILPTIADWQAIKKYGNRPFWVRGFEKNPWINIDF